MLREIFSKRDIALMETRGSFLINAHFHTASMRFHTALRLYHTALRIANRFPTGAEHRLYDILQNVVTNQNADRIFFAQVFAAANWRTE